MNDSWITMMRRRAATMNDLESGLWYSDMLHIDILIWIDLVTVVTHASALESSVKLITQNANYCKLQLRDNGNISDLGSIFGPGRQESWKTVLVNCDVIRLSLDRMCVSGQILDSRQLAESTIGPDATGRDSDRPKVPFTNTSSTSFCKNLQVIPS